ncbi:MAG TPA: oxidoreductase, partial [Planctomycetaceae bacterium]|nr:oxidoreductase [Planctomycetaceae bacterium]
MSVTPIRIAMHGVTGRMGTNQHLMRSILPIMKQGGVKLSTGQWQPIEPILVGRDAVKLKHLGETVAIEEIGRAVEFTTDFESILDDSRIDVIFDAASTNMRPEILKAAMERGKAVYCEKPIAVHEREAGE